VSTLDFPLMLQVKLPVVDTLHPQSTNCNKFATGVLGTTIQVTQNLMIVPGKKEGKRAQPGLFFVIFLGIPQA